MISRVNATDIPWHATNHEKCPRCDLSHGASSFFFFNTPPEISTSMEHIATYGAIDKGIQMVYWEPIMSVTQHCKPRNQTSEET